MADDLQSDLGTLQSDLKTIAGQLRQMLATQSAIREDMAALRADAMRGFDRLDATVDEIRALLQRAD